MAPRLVAPSLLFALCAALPSAASHTPAPPAGLVEVAIGSRAETIWPFTGTDFSGGPSDPINLVFWLDADPRAIREALLALDGNRAAFSLPDAFPFNCTWADAIGRHETAWGAAEGWQGSAIGLQCGAYDTLRFHVRLFRQGHYTLGNAHFEVLIPGTTDHEVLGWEFAEAFVRLDMARSGRLIGPPTATQVINPAPTYREIRHQVFNGLPVALRAALGLPLGNQSAPVPIPNDGRASLFALQGSFERAQADIRVEFDHPFDQVIPKPFCSSGPLDFLKVVGPIHMVHRVQTNPSGRYAARFEASGVLSVTPVNPLSGEVTGPTFQAVISETHRSSLTDQKSQAHHVISQTLLSDPQQSFFEDLWAGHTDRLVRLVECEP